MPENKTLFTDRLILRMPTFDDVNLIYSGWTSDQNTSKYVSWNTHKSLDDTKEYINYVLKEIENGTYHWIVELKATHELIGEISIVEFKKKHSTCEVGYCFGSKYWGNGYATESLRRVLEFMINDVEINLVEAKYYSCNLASGRVMQKAGMKYDATLSNINNEKEVK